MSSTGQWWCRRWSTQRWGRAFPCCAVRCFGVCCGEGLPSSENRRVRRRSVGKSLSVVEDARLIGLLGASSTHTSPDVTDQWVRRAGARNVVGSQKPCNKPQGLRSVPCFVILATIQCMRYVRSCCRKACETVRGVLPGSPGPGETHASCALWG